VVEGQTGNCGWKSALGITSTTPAIALYPAGRVCGTMHGAAEGGGERFFGPVISCQQHPAVRKAQDADATDGDHARAVESRHPPRRDRAIRHQRAATARLLAWAAASTALFIGGFCPCSWLYCPCACTGCVRKCIPLTPGLIPLSLMPPLLLSATSPRPRACCSLSKPTPRLLPPIFSNTFRRGPAAMGRCWAATGWGCFELDGGFPRACGQDIVGGGEGRSAGLRRSNAWSSELPPNEFAQVFCADFVGSIYSCGRRRSCRARVGCEPLSCWPRW
jgi:hypothetical protein